MTSRLKDLGYRMTPQRLAVIKVLSESTQHPTAEEVYTQVRIGFPTTSLATIYKTIALLKGIGEISELHFKDDSNRYDGRQRSPHPHLVCRECNRILDVEIADLTGLSEQLERSSGFDRIMPRLDFFGICPDCQRNS